MDVIEHHPPRFRWLALLLSIFLILPAAIFGASFAMAQKYQNKIYPGIMVADTTIGGLTKNQAQGVLAGKFKQTFGDGFSFADENVRKQIADDDLAIFNINLESIVNQAYQAGRSGAALRDCLARIAIFVTQKNFPLDYRLDKNLLKSKLINEFSGLQKPAQNSEITLEIKNAKKHEYDLAFSVSATGKTFDFDSAIELFENEAKQFRNPEITLSSQTDYPRITLDAALNQTEKIKELLAIDFLTLTYQDQSWSVPWEDYARMLELAQNDEEQIVVRLNPILIKGQLEAITQTVNQKAQNAKFKMENGRVVEFQPSQQGQELDLEENYQKINQQVIQEQNNTIELLVKTTEPEIATESVNELGIKEIIGAGYSNFAGSPQNRRHNIGVGSATLNGILIKPDEEFSLVKALGKIDAEHGYKPELVIKKDKTLPEFGGGLCQIGTTTFRAALASGLKITARTYHSYRVIYYEPAGLDATIYDPWPDMRFVNDTGNHILIQTKSWGDNLVFEFWGTRDGRKIRFEGQNQTEDLKKLKPKIFNVTKPGPAKEIETEELALGQKKKLESAHNGADTVFTQYITYIDGREEKNVYKSHYVPWQEVWLIGMDPLKKTLAPTLTPENPDASATPIVSQ